MNHIDTSTEAVERLLENVTLGPWVASYCSNTAPDGDEYIDRIEVETPTGRYVHEFALGYSDEIDGVTEATARFIAAARELVPALLAERDDLRAKLDAAVGALEEIAAFEVFSMGIGIDPRPTNEAKIARTTLAKIKGADHE